MFACSQRTLWCPAIEAVIVKLRLLLMWLIERVADKGWVAFYVTGDSRIFFSRRIEYCSETDYLPLSYCVY